MRRDDSKASFLSLPFHRMAPTTNLQHFGAYQNSNKPHNETLLTTSQTFEPEDAKAKNTGFFLSRLKDIYLRKILIIKKKIPMKKEKKRRLLRDCCVGDGGTNKL